MSDYISDDIIPLILRCSQVKTLVRFRCVCKGWRELIDSPAFLQDHLALQNPRYIVNYEGRQCLSVDRNSPRPLADMLPQPVSQKMGIVGTHHGVVCLRSWESDSLVIWNPSIRKSSIVPFPEWFPWDSFGFGWQDCYRFWIDPCTKGFKLLVLMFIHENGPDGVTLLHDNYGMLYSSIRNDWSRVPLEDLRDWQPRHGGQKPVMIGDVTHWIGWHALQGEDEHQQVAEVIMCFDFRLESFELIEIPSHIRHIRPCCWQGMLSLLCYDDDDISPPPYKCEIYSRQEGNSWLKVFGFDLLADTTVFWPLEHMEEMQGENCRVLRRIRPDLVIFDNKTGSIIPVKCVQHSHTKIAYNFVESLLFP